MKRVAAVLSLQLLLVTGCITMADYRAIENADDLHSMVGTKVCVTGNLSDIPWQHLVGNFKNYPHSYYFDVQKYQIMIYTKTPCDCTGPLKVFGTVVTVEGMSKHPANKEDTFKEYHITVDRWECVK
jgi:hypothetical protein